MRNKQISEYMYEEVAYRSTQVGDLISFNLAKKIRDFTTSR